MIFKNTLIAFCLVFMFLPAQCQTLIDSLKALLKRKRMVYFLILAVSVMDGAYHSEHNQKINHPFPFQQCI